LTVNLLFWLFPEEILFVDITGDLCLGRFPGVFRQMLAMSPIHKAQLFI